MRLVFFQPDIPQNLGAGLRLAACFGAGVDVIEPCGFPLNDRAMKRASLDYGPLTSLRRHASWDAYEAADGGAGRRILLTTRAETGVWDFVFAPDDRLILGRETVGAPDFLHARADARLRIPIRPEARSLNVVVAAAIALGEAERQLGRPR